MEKYHCLCIFRPSEVAAKQERLQEVVHSAKKDNTISLYVSFLLFIPNSEKQSYLCFSEILNIFHKKSK